MKLENRLPNRGTLRIAAALVLASPHTAQAQQPAAPAQAPIKIRIVTFLTGHAGWTRRRGHSDGPGPISRHIDAISHRIFEHARWYYLSQDRANMNLRLTFISLCAVISSAAHADDLPAEIAGGMRKMFPTAAILMSTPCRIGEDRLESYGLIANSNNKEETPLRAFVAFKKDGKWNVNEVNRRIENGKGFDDNFLKDFWTSNRFKKEYEIRCTTPATDVDINTKANGEYSRGFRKINASARHLCFQASLQYNSWVCVTFDKAVDNTRISFVQLNAD